MSFQAYLDAVEKKTGLTPREVIARAEESGHGADRRHGEIVAWLKAEFDLGHGHANAMAKVIRDGATISDKHVGSTGSHRDDSTELWLDGMASRP